MAYSADLPNALPLCLSPTHKVENAILDFPAPFAASVCHVTHSWPVKSNSKPVGVLLWSFLLDKEVRPIKKILFAFVFLLFLLVRTDSGSCGSHFESSPTLWGGRSWMIEGALVHDVVYNVTESLDKLQDRLSQNFLITKQ